MILNAVLCVWNEEDIIESTVKHLFAQGCSNIFIADNDSTDNTIDNAIKAGAKLAAKFTTKYFDEDQKVGHLNSIVKYINDTTSDEQIWWLYCDADEFPNFDCEFRIIDILKQLDSSIRAVHGYMFHHIPTHQPYHIQGYHPADFQPLCTKSSTSKVPLLRYDKGKKHLFSIGGAYDFITHGDIIPTLRDYLHIHHFPHRNPEYTFARLKKLVYRNSEGASRIDWYKEFSKQICKSTVTGYESRYNQLAMMYSENKNIELKIKSLLYDYKNIVRWYPQHILEIQIDYDNCIWIAVYYYFMKEYDLVLCRFKDAFDICDDDTIRLWLMIKIAECFAPTDIDTAQNIISSAIQQNNAELNEYINKHQNEKDPIIKDMIGKVEFYQSVFPPGIEQRQEELAAKIAKTLFN